MDILLGVRLHMAGDDVRAGVAELLHIAHRTLNHQVYVQRQRRHRTDGLHHRDTDGDIGHKQAVHHIHMDIVGRVNALDIPAEISKVGRKNGGGDFNHGERILSH